MPRSRLLFVTAGTVVLSQAPTQYLGPRIRLKFCQLHKRARVIRYLSDADRLHVRGAITRAFAFLGSEQAHAALMRIHTELLRCNRSAAQSLLRDLDQTLTLHQSGLVEQLSPILRSTRCVPHVAQQLTRHLRGVRGWLPPQSRRAQEDACSLAYGCQSAKRCGGLFASEDRACESCARHAGLAQGG
ncbi:MAG: hypothetical protein OXD43_12925 [Bacteroidetes bacterium]|nr:hypothetical protein [Bacteroidota bacterium]